MCRNPCPHHPQEGLVDAPAPPWHPETHSTCPRRGSSPRAHRLYVPPPCIVETPSIVGTVPNAQKSRFPLILLCLLPRLQKEFAPASFLGRLMGCLPLCDMLGRQSVTGKTQLLPCRPSRDSVSQDRAPGPQAQGSLATVTSHE